MKKDFRKFLILTLIALTILSGCNMPVPEQKPGDPTPDLNLILTQVAQEYQETAAASLPETLPETAEAAETETVPETDPTPEPTEIPVKTETLTVCLGKEPDTLFFYDESSQAMWTVLEAIYNGPFDAGDGEMIPVIFDEITVTSEPVTVIRGDIITDANGNAAEMKPGTVFRPYSLPEGCIGSACFSTWSSLSESAEMSQTVIIFRLKENLTWSDGTPLTAADSVYSMNLSGMKGISTSKRTNNLTESYTASDEHTVVWRGLPGYEPEDVSEVFWIPLPHHLMSGLSLETLRESDAVNRTPLGWGAWQITSWEKGNEIVAERNPYYVSEDGTLPFFDRIVFKFYGSAGDNNLQALHSGTCDIIDTSVNLLSELEPVLEDVRDGYQAVYIQPELTRQELVLNLDPIGFYAQDILADAGLRTALTQCIDREAITMALFLGQTEVPVDFYPAGDSRHDPALSPLAYDPETAAAMLDELGWTVPQNSETNTRTATAAAGIRYGTELAFTLYTSESDASRTAGEMIRDNLAACGAAITLEALPLGELYAQGPEGVIFGRSFDMALFAWSSSGDPCSVYRSDRIPNETNHWVGTNPGSYISEAYDAACLLPETAEVKAGQIYAEDIPAIPLYFNLSMAVSNNHICGLSDRIGSRSILWNLEQLSRSEESCAVSQWNNIYN